MKNKQQITKPSGTSTLSHLIRAALATGGMLVASGVAAQSPQGGIVTEGVASIAQAGQQTVIDQSSQRAIIDWRSFDVGRDHTVTFNQPGRSAATLNRVQSATPSLIDGTLSAPGTVVIQNTAGVVFSGTARIDTGGLVASSQLVDGDHFMTFGNFRLGGGERPGAQVSNAGTFTIGKAGLVALVGNQVENAGSIVVDMGTVVLASGETTAIDLAGDGVFQIAVSGNPDGGRVEHSGVIDAPAGRVLISAGGAAGLLDSVINTSGVIRATAGAGSGGRIELTGRGGGQVRIGGSIESRGVSSGGQIDITGETVTLDRTARVDTTGDTSGGTVRIGGGYQGTGDMRRATKTILHTGSEVRADGTLGKGGTVIVWSDDATWFDGHISATGATSGGLIETSGKISLGIGENATVLAGTGGQWLLDPRNVEIVGNTGANVSGGVNNPPVGAGVYQINSSSILAALNAGSDVTITTTQPSSFDDGDIRVSAALSWAGGGHLNLDADGSIFVDRAIATLGAGDLTLNAGDLVDINNTVRTNGTGDIVLNAGRNIRFDRPVLSSAVGAVTATAGRNIEINRASRITGSGDMTLDAGNTITVTSQLRTTQSGDLILRAGNGVTVNNNVFASRTGGISITATTGNIILGGFNGNQRISTNEGDLALNAVDGSVLLERTNSRARTTSVYSNSGNLDITAGTEILLQGGAVSGQSVALGRSGDSARISLTAPTISVLAGDTVNNTTARIRTGTGGALSIAADTFTVETGDAAALAEVAASGGATLSLDAATQTWDGEIAGSGDVEVTGDVIASVQPDFVLDSGANFSLNSSNPSGSLTATAVPFDVTTSGGRITVGGSVQAPQARLETDTDLILESGASITATGTGDAIVVAAGDRFENAAGAGALQLTDSAARWLVYMNDFDSLVGTAPASDSFDLYNKSFAANPPSSLTPFTGNRIVYAEQPVLQISANSFSKTYGEDGTGSLAATLTGLRSGDTVASALTAPVSITSAGAAAAAPVAGSPFAIAVAATASDQGYRVVLTDGTLTVDPAALTVTAQDATRTVGAPNPPLTATLDGFVLGQTIADLGGSLSVNTAATPASPAGAYAITAFGLASTNYAIRFVDGTLTVQSQFDSGAVASDQSNGGAIEQRIGTRRAAPITPGDAAFRTTDRDVALAGSDPFTLTYSLGEVLTFQPIAQAGSEGFVPAAGGLGEVPGDAATCGVAVNLNGQGRDGCVGVVVTESYWDQQ